jgi:hypothetical protein
VCGGVVSVKEIFGSSHAFVARLRFVINDSHDKCSGGFLRARGFELADFKSLLALLT